MKVWTSSEVSNQVKSDIENFKYLYKIMAELGENAAVYSLLPQLKNYQIHKSLWYFVLFMKGKTGISVVPDHSFTKFFF